MRSPPGSSRERGGVVARLDRVMHRLGNAIIRASQPLGPHFCRGECQVTRMSAFRDIGGYDERITVGEDWDLFKRLDRIGNVAFINDLKVMHSTRRFRQYGYGATFLLYLREAASLVFLRRSWLKRVGSGSLIPPEPSSAARMLRPTASAANARSRSYATADVPRRVATRGGPAEVVHEVRRHRVQPNADPRTTATARRPRLSIG